MIPLLAPDEYLPAIYASFIKALENSGFSGEIRTDYATRLVTATDNSVYQIVPLAVVYPRNETDVACVLELANDEEYREVKLSPRGGGTGTNGQSLCDGVIMDVSRHFGEILELNLAEGWVRVQPGVVLDQLNAFLAPHDVFFAPNLSPSSRATLGGMINTDASGKGSRIYGKTSDHVLALRSVMMDGKILETLPLDPEEFALACKKEGMPGRVYCQVAEIVESSRERIKTDLPKLKRFLTGYDLAHIETPDGKFDLSRVIAGSEGTLVVLTEAKLRLTPIARHRQLVAIRYPEFDSALRDAGKLVASNPGAIETVDDTIVGLARGDTIWSSISHLVEGKNEPPAAAINLVEFESDDPALVQNKVEELCASLNTHCGKSGQASGYTVATTAQDIAALWSLRKKGVGLLGNAKGARRPVAFVEDTAVPPEHLADYIRDFRALLDKRGLRYGMFGHVDVGCLHVRPALDLKSEKDEALLRGITDEVVALVKKYGGVLWGEHGKGYRSEYTPTFFGDALYKELRRVKSAFDPHNQLNPGKLATPSASTDQLVSVDAMKRGAYDRQIAEPTRKKFEASVNCNGNGACFDWNPDSVMCPSSKVTRDRIHSPKGRAGILREWLRLLAQSGHDAGAKMGADDSLSTSTIRGRDKPRDDFSHQVYDAMAGCLACKACATQCPVKVDIPALRAEFLEQYHGRYRRPLKDYFVAALESILSILVLWPRLSNWLMTWAPSKWFIRRWVGMIDTPLLAEDTLKAGLKERGAESFDFSSMNALSKEDAGRVVLIAQDAFTTFYEPQVALAAYDLLTKLGRRVIFLPFRENGKALHIKGFLGRFRKVVRSNSVYFAKVFRLGIPIVGIEPAVTLTYRDEYPHELGKEMPEFRIQLLQEYLEENLEALIGKRVPTATSRQEPYQLFGHCTERTFETKSQEKWKAVFERFGAAVSVKATGCCGMCGVFGHEEEHLEESRGIFEMSWKKQLPESGAERARVMATGHSCRSQVKRFEGFVPRHPAEALLDYLNTASSSEE